MYARLFTRLHHVAIKALPPRLDFRGFAPARASSGTPEWAIRNATKIMDVAIFSAVVTPEG
jgi:hypothetical protein